MRIVPFDPVRLDDLLSFFQAAHASAPIAWAFRDRAGLAARWRWLNEGYPLWRDGEPRSWVCVDDGRIIGHVAHLPVEIVSSGQVLRVSWARDLIVDPEARGRGIGPSLISHLVAQVGRALLGGMNPQVEAMYRRLGYVHVAQIPLHIRVHDADGFLDGLHWSGPRRIAGAVAIGGAGLVRRSPSSRLRVQVVDRIGGWFDAWWAGIEPRFQGAARRNARLMSWRYREHPSHDYTILAASDASGHRGVAVIRSGVSRGMPAGFVVELLAAPDDAAAFETLLSGVEDALGVQRRPTFTRFASLGMSARRLLRFGYLPAPSPLGLMVAARDPADQFVHMLGRGRGWLINTGDSDLDAI